MGMYAFLCVCVCEELYLLSDLKVIEEDLGFPLHLS